ncbi:hypothetical protein ACLOJK_025254 [Asimina triloba]
MATPHHQHHIPIKEAARKLPIKRKTPHSSPNPNPNPNPNHTTISPVSSYHSDDDDDNPKAPSPFKFQRIWPEADELRFLQALLDAGAQGLSFPRDLAPFFQRFACSCAQPYSKSQLAEKLRRLRKKFRVLSARLSRGLDASLLTPHDRALLHLSKQLWHPAFAASSPFTATAAAASKKKPSPPPPAPAAEVKAPVSFSSPYPAAPTNECRDTESGNLGGSDLFVKVESLGSPTGGGLCREAAKTVMDVFEHSLNEVRMALAQRGLLHHDHLVVGASSNGGKMGDLAKRWQEQRVAELDVLGRRLMLVLEQAISK